MSTPTFYHPDLRAADHTAELVASEASHALKSRRLQTGQDINLINGKGLLAFCKIESRDRNRMSVLVERIKEFSVPSRQLTIASAIPKGDRQRSMIDILTQHRLTRLIPLQCERSVTAYNDKLLEKWQRYAIEACKQSQNPWLPEFQAACSIPELLGWLGQQVNTQAAYADGNGQKMPDLARIGEHMVLLIGPEGGFSRLEIELFENAKLAPLRLADSILRTEAAAITAAAQFFAL